jgi:hypothetical protein
VLDGWGHKARACTLHPCRVLGPPCLNNFTVELVIDRGTDEAKGWFVFLTAGCVQAHREGVPVIVQTLICLIHHHNLHLAKCLDSAMECWHRCAIRANAWFTTSRLFLNLQFLGLLQQHLSCQCTISCLCTSLIRGVSVRLVSTLPLLLFRTFHCASMLLMRSPQTLPRDAQLAQI